MFLFLKILSWYLIITHCISINFVRNGNMLYNSLSFSRLCLKYEFLDTLNYKDEELWQKCTKTWIEADTKILEKFGGKFFEDL